MRMLSIATMAFVFTGLGLAGAAEETTAKTVPASSKAEQEGAPIGSPVQTFGKVTSLHSCAMVGAAAPHMIVKLQTEQGDTDIVDLGSTDELKTNGIEPKEGQKFFVEGRVGKINDKFLIVAERLSETKLVTIARSTPLREETVKHAEARNDGKVDTTVAETKDVIEIKDGQKDGQDVKVAKSETVDAGQQVRTVEGTVIHSRHVKIEGEADEHVIAKIQTENGIAVIDLGTCAAMPNSVDLTVGKSLAATGFIGKLNGKPIILADSVGNLSGIQRPADRPTTPGTSTPVSTK